MPFKLRCQCYTVCLYVLQYYCINFLYTQLICSSRTTTKLPLTKTNYKLWHRIPRLLPFWRHIIYSMLLLTSLEQNLWYFSSRSQYNGYKITIPAMENHLNLTLIWNWCFKTKPFLWCMMPTFTEHARDAPTRIYFCWITKMTLRKWPRSTIASFMYLANSKQPNKKS